MKIASRNENNEINYYGINKKVILIDIGGYFSKVSQKNDLPILGIIEDTENGIQKYECNLEKIKYPLFSVARNILKENEDCLVGKDIAFGADYILHKENLLLQYMNVACIGYGKIGKGICLKLKEMGVKPEILEINNIRAVEAVRDGCKFLFNKDNLNFDIIFCATGSKSLNILDFRTIKDGTYIVSATSSDDEFELDYLELEYKKSKISKYIVEYRNEFNYFYLLNNGIPTNFMAGASLWNYILLVHATIINAIKNIILANGNIKIGEVQEINEKENDKIAYEWLRMFYN